MVRRFERWVREYDERRFLSNFSHEHLSDRFRDILTNCASLRGVPARLGTHEDDHRQGYWGRKFVHVDREFQLRGTRPNADETEIPLPTDPKTQAAARLCARFGTPPAGSLIKYGELRYLRELLDHGRALIRPASYYSSTDLSQAIKDDELQFERIVPADRLPSMTLRDGKTRAVKNTNMRPLSMSLISRMESDYYLYCLSSAWDPRLFLMDSRYDAALVIHRPQPLLMLDAAVRECGPEFHPFEPFEVDYVDPVEARDDECALPVCKHFRYAYQEEVRTVWWPVTLSESLPELSIEVGPIGKWATLVRL
ncbi:MAG: hypothetical protein NXI31_09105 [bacterium]|nr:hypothetical protein [bacterium]